jgi:multisubunit Na+/H+ antiporter MnhF subunit
MSGWQLAALVLLAGLVPCLIVATRCGLRDALAALELAGTLTATALMILAQAYARQPFLDLALVLALTTNLGALVFARMMEGEL